MRSKGEMGVVVVVDVDGEEEMLSLGEKGGWAGRGINVL